MMSSYRPSFWSTSLVLALFAFAPDSSAQQAKPNQWSLSLSLRETRGLDVFRNDEPQPDEIIDSATAGFGFAALRERSSVNVFGRVGGNRRQDLNNSTQLTYGGHLVWNYRKSARSNMSLSTSVSKNLRLDTLTALGVLPGDVSTLTSSSSWSFQHRAGPRTNWSVGTSYQYYDFGSRTGIPSSQVVLDQEPFGDEFAVQQPQPLPGSTADPVILPSGETDVLRIFATEGLSAGGTKAHLGALTFGFGHRLTERTSFNASVQGSYQTVQRVTDTSGPRGGVQLALSRSIRTSQSLNTSYTFQRSFVGDPGVSVHSLSAGWSYSHLTSSVTVNLSAGASQFRSEGSSNDIFPIADASVSWGITSSTSLGVAYRRQFSVPFGFGRSSLIDYANVGLTQNIGRASLTISTGASFSEDPTMVQPDWQSKRAGANLSVRVAGPLSANFSFIYAENDRRDDLVVDSTRRRLLSMNLNYTPTW